jgi:hypothetical protein
MAIVSLAPISVLNEAVKAVPAVRYALGVGGIVAVIALIYTFPINPRVAFVGVVAMFVFMGVLVVFAAASTLRDGAIVWPALVFTWFVLIMFMATAASLFSCVFFGKPLDLQDWLTGRPTVAAVAPAQPNSPPAISRPSPPDIPNADSGWVGGGSSPNSYCDPLLKAYRQKYPDFNVTMTPLAEQHKSEYNPFKQDFYRYGCSFAASAK